MTILPYIFYQSGDPDEQPALVFKNATGRNTNIVAVGGGPASDLWFDAVIDFDHGRATLLLWLEAFMEFSGQVSYGKNLALDLTALPFPSWVPTDSGHLNCVGAQVRLHSTKTPGALMLKAPLLHNRGAYPGNPDANDPMRDKFVLRTGVLYGPPPRQLAY